MAHGKRLAGRSEAWLGGQGGAGEGDRTTEAERGSSLRFLPPSPSLGFSKPKPAAYLKKKKKKALKESYRQLQKNPTNTHRIQTVLRPPCPPPPNTRVSSFISFHFRLSPLRLGGQGRLLVGGGRHAAGRAHLWPEGGGSGSPHYLLDPDTHQPASWAPARRGDQGQLVPTAGPSAPLAFPPADPCTFST